jgi:hypothetical protein
MNRSGREPADGCTFFYGNGDANHSLDIRLFERN